ncbi:hypothetical protein FRC03_002839 [Tulasnella sp. 419]|nr:hypothetical protein FRC03_002839 [Tulasnella sp. 419]
MSSPSSSDVQESSNEVPPMQEMGDQLYMPDLGLSVPHLSSSHGRKVHSAPSEMKGGDQDDDAAQRNDEEQNKTFLRLGSDKASLDINDHAQFWSTYDRVSGAFDREFLDAWHKSLDVLLIFAGLFSAINTAFIMDSYKGLGPDPAETTNDLLRLLISHRNDNITLSLDDLHPGNSSPHIVPINCLFFASLSFSLTAAFGAVTAKQWLTEYGNIGAMKAHHIQGRRRQEKYQGLKSWHLRFIIELLPILLQLSLLLFLIGVVHLLWPLNHTVAIFQGVLSGVAFLAYILTVLIGIAIPTSPFQTPFSRYFPHYRTKVRRFIDAIFQKLRKVGFMDKARTIFSQVLPWSRQLHPAVKVDRLIQCIESLVASSLQFINWSPKPEEPAGELSSDYDSRTNSSQEGQRMGWDGADITAAESVVWLLEQAEHPDVTITALDAVPRLPADLLLSLFQKHEGLLERLAMFHNSLIPPRPSRDTRIDWTNAYPEQAIVSGLALNHILGTNQVLHGSVPISLKLRTLNCQYNHELSVNNDALSMTKILLNINLELPHSHAESMRHVASTILQNLNPSLASPYLISIGALDGSRSSIGDHLVSQVIPLELALNAVISLACNNLITPWHRPVDHLGNSVLSAFDHLLRTEVSRDIISHIAIAIAAIYSPPDMLLSGPEMYVVIDKSRKRLRRTIMARCSAHKKGEMVLENVALALSFIHDAAAGVTIFENLLTVATDLFCENFSFLNNPLSYIDFPHHLLQLSRSSQSNNLKRCVARLLRLCPDGSWIAQLHDNHGRDLHVLCECTLLEESDMDFFHSRTLFGELLDKIVRASDQTQLVDTFRDLEALKRYCKTLLTSRGLSIFDVSYGFLDKMMEMRDEVNLLHSALLEAQITFTVAAVALDILNWGRIGHLIVDFLNYLIQKDQKFEWPAYLSQVGFLTFNEESGRRPIKYIEVQQLLTSLQSNVEWRNIWRGEAILQLWKISRQIDIDQRDMGILNEDDSPFLHQRTVDTMSNYWGSVRRLRASQMYCGLHPDHRALEKYLQECYKMLCSNEKFVELLDRDASSVEEPVETIAQILQELQNLNSG